MVKSYGCSLRAQRSKRAFERAPGLEKMRSRGYNRELGAVDVQVEMFTSKHNSKSFAFGLGIALFYGT